MQWDTPCWQLDQCLGTWSFHPYHGTGHRQYFYKVLSKLQQPSWDAIWTSGYLEFIRWCTLWSCPLSALSVQGCWLPTYLFASYLQIPLASDCNTAPFDLPSSLPLSWPSLICYRFKSSRNKAMQYRVLGNGTPLLGMLVVSREALLGVDGRQKSLISRRWRVVNTYGAKRLAGIK